MNNKLKLQLTALLLIAGTSNLYAKGEYTVNSKKGEKPHYFKYIAEKDLNNSSYNEPRAYKYFGKTVDEFNNKKGIKTNYFSKASLDKYDEIDEVVAIRNMDNKEDFQVYLGNNNNINNFKVLSENKFKEEEKEKNVKYDFNGYYEILNNSQDSANPTNSLGITIEEYKSNIENKNKDEISKFLKNKIKEKLAGDNIKVFEKDGTLYTKDNDGNEWKVFYTNPKPYSKEQTLQGETKFEDKIYQYVFLYKNDENKILYKKDNSIYIENPKLDNFYFVGKGKINGEIDLGGDNKTLYVDTQVSSRYGTNIILGKDAKLKNISKIVIGQDASGAKKSGQKGELGGMNLNPTTLTFDLDENAVNEKGYLYKHVLFNTDAETRNKVQFKGPGYSDPYTINLMLSKVNEDKTVDMMKKESLAGSQWFSYQEKFDVGVFKSDSFTHLLSKRTDDKDSDESSLLDIKVRKKFKRLSNKENDVYSSIVNAKKIGLFSPTTTTVNKKVFFTSDDTNKLENKIVKLKKYLMEESSTEKIIKELQDTNIYSKVNKIAKNEISTYTNLPFDINHNLFEDMKKNKHYVKGGFISSRTVQDNFKGNTYTAYGLYENKLSKKNILGFMLGGVNTDFKLTHNKRTATTTPAYSTSKGVSTYMGAYLNKQVKPNFNWILGTGVQYGSYKINRQLKNNYQELVSKGKAKVGAINTYTGAILNFPVHEDVSFQVKGILSHTFVNQSKVNENDGLPLNIKAQNYNYIDGELGVAVTKTLFDYDVKSSLSAGIYGVAGLYGYKNKDLRAKVKNSTSNFDITGDKIKKDALKIFIDYNVQEETGLNYGLSGTYLTNSEENNVKIGVKAGYVF